MGHTNSTANLSLPQFIGTDKPTWLGDVNGAFLAIDGYAGTNDAAVAAAASDASSALSQASAAVNTANTANTTAGNASTAANNAVGVANTANAIAGTVDAKVGLLADLNTVDKTSIVKAINETHDVLSVTYTRSGSITYGNCLDALYALLNTAVGANRVRVLGLRYDTFDLTSMNPNIRASLASDYNFCKINPQTSPVRTVTDNMQMKSSGSIFVRSFVENGATPTVNDLSAVTASETSFTVFYQIY